MQPLRYIRIHDAWYQQQNVALTLEQDNSTAKLYHKNMIFNMIQILIEKAIDHMISNHMLHHI